MVGESEFPLGGKEDQKGSGLLTMVVTKIDCLFAGGKKEERLLQKKAKY